MTLDDPCTLGGDGSERLGEEDLEELALSLSSLLGVWSRGLPLCCSTAILAARPLGRGGGGEGEERTMRWGGPRRVSARRVSTRPWPLRWGDTRMGLQIGLPCRRGDGLCPRLRGGGEGEGLCPRLRGGGEEDPPRCLRGEVKGLCLRLRGGGEGEWLCLRLRGGGEGEGLCFRLRGGGEGDPLRRLRWGGEGKGLCPRLRRGGEGEGLRPLWWGGRGGGEWSL